MRAVTGGEVQGSLHRVVFTSDGRCNKETDTQICKASTVLRELDRSVVTKRHRKASYLNRCLF